MSDMSLLPPPGKKLIGIFNLPTKPDGGTRFVFTPDNGIDTDTRQRAEQDPRVMANIRERIEVSQELTTVYYKMFLGIDNDPCITQSLLSPYKMANDNCPELTLKGVDYLLEELFTQAHLKDQLSMLDLPNLPFVAIKEILTHVPCSSTDKENTILACRLVCGQWNDIITFTPELMKKMTFTVKNPQEFLNMAIVKERKVNSIKFVNCSVLESEASVRDQFITTMGNTIESINISFEQGTNLQQQKSLFNIILQDFTKLQELTINNNENESMESCRTDELFRDITEDTQIIWSNSIKSISIGLCGFEEADAIGFCCFLLKLPRLENIMILFGDELYWNCDSIVIEGLCNYLAKYGSSKALALHLKKLSFKVQRNERIGPSERYVQLLLLCSQYGIIHDDLPEMNWNHFLTFRVPPSLLQLIRDKRRNGCPPFQARIDGHLTFTDRGFEPKHLNRLHFLNFGVLKLICKRNIKQGELSWIKQVGSIKSLIIVLETRSYNSNVSELNLESTNEFMEAFSAGLPSLEKLSLQNETFFHFLSSLRIPGRNICQI